MSDDTTELFSTLEIGMKLHFTEQEWIEEVDKIEGDAFLQLRQEIFRDMLVEKYRITIPTLDEENIEVKPEEVSVDISNDPMRFVRNRSKPILIKGTKYSCYIPYEGNKDLFLFRPTVFTLNPPNAIISESELILTHTQIEHDQVALAASFKNTFIAIQQCLKELSKDVEGFNSSLSVNMWTRIQGRREKLLGDHFLASSLGFRLRRSENPPQTYTVPLRLRSPRVPQINEKKPLPLQEPSFDIQEYEHILSIILNMVAVIERSPKAFRNMDEEDLRQHFLVQLNGQYEGQATGETFNMEGKTDILIRVGGKNIFIAECKFWKGPQAINEAIDQLLGYVAWHDTKTALLVFNRNKNFSEMLSNLSKTVASHPNCVRQEVYDSETGFRYTFSHRHDADRQILLTVLAFEMPL